jgi:tape measure domain-containing protein
MATTLDNVIIVFSARGAGTTAKRINEIGFSSARAQNSTRGLGKSLAGLGALLAVRQVVAYADSVTELENRLRLVSDTSEEVAFRTQAIFDIASKTRGNLEETSRTFFRFGRANKELGLSEKELLEITETVNQAVAFSGTSAESAASALFQFSQGIAANSFRGQELNAVLEQIPGLAETIAAGLGKPVASFRKLGAEGFFTGQVLADALLKGKEFAQSNFDKIIFTASQEMERLRTETIQFVGALDDSIGFSDKLTAAIRFLADNLDIVAKVLAVVGLRMAAAFGAATLALVATLFAFIRRHPFVFLAQAIGTAVSVLTVFRDEIVLVEETGVTLGQVMQVLWDDIQSGAVRAFEAVKKASGDFFTTFRDGFANSKFLQALSSMLKDSLKVMEKWVNPAIGLLTLPIRLMIVSFQKAPKAIGDILFRVVETFRQVFTGEFDIRAFFTGIVDFIIDAFKKGFELIGDLFGVFIEKISEFDLSSIPAAFNAVIDKVKETQDKLTGQTLENPFEGALQEYRDAVIETIKETFTKDFIQALATEFGIAQDAIQDILDRATKKTKGGRGGGTLRTEAKTERLPLPEKTSLDAATIDEITKAFNKFSQSEGNEALRETLDLLRDNRAEVIKFPEAFGISADKVEEEIARYDLAITNLEKKISGSVDLQKELWIGLADTIGDTLVEGIINPAEFSLAKLESSVIDTVSRIVAEFIVAQAKLAALNFLQGLTSFAIPGATAAIPTGKALGGVIIGGQPRLVGERGPEIIMPSNRSRVIPNEDISLGNTGSQGIQKQLDNLTEGIKSGAAVRPIQVNMTVNTPDANSFRTSENQTLARVENALRRATTRNG